MLRLGLLGGGNIGYRIAEAVVDGTLPYHLAALAERNPASRERLIDLRPGLFIAESLDDLCRSCDVLVEAAAPAVVPELISTARRQASHGPVAEHLVILSVGGLLDYEPAPDGPVVHAPSGAIGGLEAVQALAVAGLDEVTLTSRKPPAGLDTSITEETVLFEGSARDAIARFPKNVNVAVALSLAGLGPDRTTVRLIADPAVDRNTHHVRARGTAGEVEFISRNVPFPANPATSYLAALSAIALLQRLAGRLRIG